MDDDLIRSIQAAVVAAPSDLTLRLHLARLLVSAGRQPEAVEHAAAILSVDPTSARAQELMARALRSDPSSGSRAQDAAGSYDWSAAEGELGDAVPPMFIGNDDGDADPTPAAHARAFDSEPSSTRLADVGGMTEVKKRLDAAFLAPLRNPKLRELYGKSLRGGLLLFGPPGCGKTFLARAVAGELGAAFIHVSLADILDMYIGSSERNVQELFETARASAPCVLFLDELDAIGQKRSLTRNSGMRTTVNQLLTELDGVGSTNEGVFLLAATNHPWDVDPALRRPGRLDRTILVLPPDRPAREAIFRHHLANRPVENISLTRLAKQTDGYSGADIAHICESASELALLDSVASGEVRMIRMADLEAALADVRPSIGPWMETARNVALFANDSGEYDELAKYLRKRGRS